jgi:hypothetical protein
VGRVIKKGGDMFVKIKICFMLLVALVIAQENNYVPGEIIVYFKKDVVALPPGQVQGGIEVIQGPDSLRIYLNIWDYS